MKKITLFILAAFAMASCTEESKRNDPALQGLKNGLDWRAGGSQALLGVNGDITITGGLQFETLTLELPSTDEGTYTLGTSSSRMATFEITADGVEDTFYTGTGRGDGQIVIEEYDEAGRTISGTFRFNAVSESSDTPEDPENSEVLNFQSGVFYKVPVVPTAD